MPYRDPHRSLVKYWFNSCDGSDAKRFCQTISEANQEQLEAEGGVCIMYAHFARDFAKDGRVETRTEHLLRRLAQREGWFVSVSTLLDFLRSKRGDAIITPAEYGSMERRWALDRCGLLARRSVRYQVSSGHDLREASHVQATSKKAIRIVHLTSAHGPFDVRIFHKECRSLARSGYEVIEIGNFEFNGTVDGVTIRGLNRRGGRLYRSTVSLVSIAREAMRTAADLYHLHDPELLLIGLLLRATGRRVIYDIHEDLPRTVLFKAYLPRRLRNPLMWAAELLENMLARQMSALVAATPALAERFRRFRHNTIAINNYVMLDEFTPPKKEADNLRGPIVTYYGGMSTERGIYEMLAAMDLIPNELGAKLELAGSFYVQEQQKNLMALPEWRHVIWHGELGRADLALLLRRVQVGLVVLHPHPAYLTSHPTKLFEYMAAGIPVVASDFPLWRSIVENADCGLLVNPLDASAIAAAITSLIKNPDEARKRGMRGRKAAERHFNWAMEERLLLSFYSSLLPAHSAFQEEPAMAYPGRSHLHS